MFNKFLQDILSTNSLINFLLLLLVFYFTFVVMMKLFNKKAIAITLGLTTSLLVIFYIKLEQLILLFNLYGTMGMLILILAPFLFCVFFIYSSNISSIFRKLFFIFYGITSIILFKNIKYISQENFTIISSLIILIIIAILFLDKKIENIISNENKFLRKY